MNEKCTELTIDKIIQIVPIGLILWIIDRTEKSNNTTAKTQFKSAPQRFHRDNRAATK